MKWTVKLPTLAPAVAVAISYLAIMLTGGAITSVIMAPLQAPDENHHFLRAAQIADGALFPRAVDGYPGVVVDSGYAALVRDDAVSRVTFHYSEKFDRAAIDRINSLRLQGSSEPMSTPNIAYYFATGYLPQAAGIRLARIFSGRVMVHLISARVMNCLVASVLIGLAICLFPPAMPIFITVSALPMSLFLLSSTSQDALLIANSMLLAAISMRLLCGAASVAPIESPNRPQEESWLGIGAFAVTLLLALGRPTYVVLALFPASVLLLLDWRRYWKPIIAAVLLIVTAVLSYLNYVQGLGPQLISPGAEPAAQLRTVMANPLVFLQALFRTNYSNIAYEVIGVLGWLDTLLPARLYAIARWVLLAALAATALAFASSNMRARALVPPWARLVVVVAGIAAVAAAAVLSAFVLYLITSPVGDTSGVHFQGRYLLPLLPILACAILAPLLAEPIRLPQRITGRLFTAATCGISVLLLGAMIASFVVMDITLIDRYYLP